MPCTQDSECESSACLAIGGLSQCASACTEGVPCDGGLVCQKRDPRSLASPTICGEAPAGECVACNTDSDCGEYGRACLQATEGKVCGIDCTVDDNACPRGFRCISVADDAGQPLSKQCLPDAGVCFCKPGQTSGCTPYQPPTTPQTSCTSSTCDVRPAGPDVVHMPPPANCKPSAEVCNGIDDDCDGAIDEGADGKIISEVCGTGHAPCIGKRVCSAGRMSACDAPQPKDERDQGCNGVDDDCNGEIDDGLIGSTDACSACGDVCPGAGQEATSTRTCDADGSGGFACGLTCNGDNYDSDDDAANGCEALDDIPARRTSSTAYASTNGTPQVVDDSENSFVSFAGRFGADIELRARLDVGNLPTDSLYEVCLSTSKNNATTAQAGFASCGARPAGNPLSWCKDGGFCCCAYGGRAVAIPLAGRNIDDSGDNAGTYYARVSWLSGTFIPNQSMQPYELRICDDGEEHTCPAASDCNKPRHCVF